MKWKMLLGTLASIGLAMRRDYEGFIHTGHTRKVASFKPWGQQRCGNQKRLSLWDLLSRSLRKETFIVWTIYCMEVWADNPRVLLYSSWEGFPIRLTIGCIFWRIFLPVSYTQSFHDGKNGARLPKCLYKHHSLRWAPDFFLEVWNFSPYWV